MRKLKIWHFLGLIILVFILMKIDWPQMRVALSRVKPLWLILSFLISIPQIGLKSIRWKSLLAIQGHPVPTKVAFLFYLSSIYLGIITPARLGEFAKALYLRQTGVTNLSRALSSVLLDRIFDLYLLFVLAMIGLITILSWPDAEPFGWLGIAGAILLPFACLHLNKLEKAVSLFYQKFLSPKLPTPVKGEAEKFWRGIQDLIDLRLLWAGGLTVISNAFFFLQCFLISLALALPLSYLEIVPIMAMTNLITFFPLSISGLGTREAALWFLLSPRGFDLETVLAFSLGVLFVFFIGGAILGAAAWGMQPLKFHQEHRY